MEKEAPVGGVSSGPARGWSGDGLRRPAGSQAPAAFTLVELLIVVAIIGVLASIAVPNLLQAQVRAKVAAAEESMRVMAVGLEAYHVDHGAYPPARLSLPPYGDPAALTQTWGITTPVAFISQVPLDRFHEPMNFGLPGGSEALPGGPFGPNGRYIHYIADPVVTEYWLLWSYGPDREMEFDERKYDPTNGTVSDGDIYRVGSPR